MLNSVFYDHLCYLSPFRTWTSPKGWGGGQEGGVEGEEGEEGQTPKTSLMPQVNSRTHNFPVDTDPY